MSSLKHKMPRELSSDSDSDAEGTDYNNLLPDPGGLVRLGTKRRRANSAESSNAGAGGIGRVLTFDDSPEVDPRYQTPVSLRNMPFLGHLQRQFARLPRVVDIGPKALPNKARPTSKKMQDFLKQTGNRLHTRLDAAAAREEAHLNKTDVVSGHSPS